MEFYKDKLYDNHPKNVVERQNLDGKCILICFQPIYVRFLLQYN